MCGLAALFAYRPDAPPIVEAPLLVMREAMIARGPDGAGPGLGDAVTPGVRYRPWLAAAP